MKKCITIFFTGLILSTGFVFAQRKMENLGRGVVAIRTGSSSVFISWRLLGLDPSGIGFNVYRSAAGGTAVKLNSSVLTAGTNYTDNSANLAQANAYFVRPVISGVEQAASGSFNLTANHATEPCFRVPVRNTGEIHLAWVGDLDGDGEYDFVIDRLGTRQKCEAYKRDGTFLWATDQGPNSDNTNNTEYESRPSTLSSGNWDGVTVFDMDGDGKAEVLLKTANGVVFGNGTTLTVSDNDAQFISVLNGTTGAERARIQWPTDYKSDGWMGMNFGIGYLNGTTPSLIVKGKNRVGMEGFNQIVCAYSFNGSTITQQWKWLRGNQDAPDGHQIRIQDVDGNGTDEISEIGFCLNSNGTVRYSLGPQGVIHGDRFHIGKFDPNRAGLQGFGIQQDNASTLLYFLFDASTGNVYRKHMLGNEDSGRGVISDLDPRYPGCEYWSFHGIHRIDNGDVIATAYPWPNFRIWWDGDVLAENLNETNVNDWDYINSTKPNLLGAASYGAVDSYRDAPAFYGDIYGDWREEVVFASGDYTQLLVFTTPIATSTRLYTLAHNPEYRNCMTIKGYMQQHNLDYFLGNGMSTPPTPNIVYVSGGGSCNPTAITPYIQVNDGTWQQISSVTVNSGDKVILGPQPLSGGSWSWTGCGTSGSSREQTIYPTGSCTSTATYTNSCGATSTQAFNVTIGGGGTETITYQAESYTSMSGIAVSTQYSGYTGSGFADYGGNGTWLEWNNVASARAGSATLVFRYANGHSSGANRQCAVTVNGTSAGNVAFATTGSWSTWNTVSISATLNSGTNSVRVTANTSNGGPNVDKMDVTSLKSSYGIEETADLNNKGTNKILISPNPLTGNYLNLKLDLISQSEIEIFINDISGKAVLRNNLGTFRTGSVDEVIDLGLLTKGIYILTVKTKENTISEKLIKD